MSPKFSSSIVQSEGVVTLNGFQIHWEKFGTGSQIILLLPGALGTAYTDFSIQIEGEHAFNLSKYTFVVMTLPGWGKSRPPVRPYGMEVYENDVRCCAQLMEHLNYNSYYVIGWSDGAKSALLLAILYPSRIQAVVAAGIFIYCTRLNLLPFMRMQNVSLWDADMLARYRQVYSHDELQTLWDTHINFIKELMNKIKTMSEARPDLKDIKLPIHERLMNGLNCIRCPVLLVHGDKVKRFLN